MQDPLNNIDFLCWIRFDISLVLTLKLRNSFNRYCSSRCVENKYVCMYMYVLSYSYINLKLNWFSNSQNTYLIYLHNKVYIAPIRNK